MRFTIFIKKDSDLDIVTFYDGEEEIFDRCKEAEVFEAMKSLQKEWPSARFLVEK